MTVDDLQRCLAFERELSEKVVTSVAPWRFGTSLSTPHLNLMRDLNFVYAEPDPNSNAVEVAAEAEGVQAGLGLPHRKIRVLDEEWGQLLSGDFVAMGWKVDRFVTMVYAGPGRAETSLHPVRELSHAEYKAFHRLSLEESSPAIVPEAIDQIVAITEQMAARADVRFMGVESDGTIGAACEIISDGSTAQIESVTTLQGHRKKGLARSLMNACIAEAAVGHDFIFLVADDEDWPKDFYTRLGFRTVGHYCDLVIVDVTGSGEERG